MLFFYTIFKLTWWWRKKNVKNYTSNCYGREDRHKNADFKHKVISQIMGADLLIMEFHMAKESRDYPTLCSEIKTLLADIKKVATKPDI